MIKLLLVSGSPIDDSSTDLILSTTAKALTNSLPPETESQVDIIKLNEHKFICCQACGKAPAGSFCFYDDLTKEYQLLAECDCLLFGSPIYFDSVSAQAKAFIDRCNCFRPPDYDNADPDHDFIKRLKRKRPGAIFLVGSENAYFEGARRVIAGFFKWVEVVNEGYITFESKDFNVVGAASGDEQKLAEAQTLGRHLANLLMNKYER